MIILDDIWDNVSYERCKRLFVVLFVIMYLSICVWDFGNDTVMLCLSWDDVNERGRGWDWVCEWFWVGCCCCFKGDDVFELWVVNEKWVERVEVGKGMGIVLKSFVFVLYVLYCWCFWYKTSFMFLRWWWWSSLLECSKGMLPELNDCCEIKGELRVCFNNVLEEEIVSIVE